MRSRASAATLLCALGLLAGCGGDDKESGSRTGGTATSTTAPARTQSAGTGTTGRTSTTHGGGSSDGSEFKAAADRLCTRIQRDARALLTSDPQKARKKGLELAERLVAGFKALPTPDDAAKAAALKRMIGDYEALLDAEKQIAQLVSKGKSDPSAVGSPRMQKLVATITRKGAEATTAAKSLELGACTSPVSR